MVNKGRRMMRRRRRMNLALLIHNHQPVDNDPAIVEQVYQRAYLPFIRKLAEYPAIRANIHYSGYLLEWIEREHPDFIDLLREMVRRGQIEMIGGGYYEPILACIPDRDAKGQVSLLSDKIRSLFGERPAGLWTAERAWEPQMPEVLQRCGIRYTALDDTIFGRSGVTERECLRPYLVESRGSTVTVFPILKRLRYLIPWKSERVAVAFLRSSADDASSGGRKIAVFGDDGEKFGAWPTTFEKVYGGRWLSRFFELIVGSADWLSTVSLSEYLEGHSRGNDRAYLPSASYDEMMEWSIPRSYDLDDDVLKKKTTGFWRDFLAKYPESGRMYAKMLSVSRLSNMVDASERSESLLEVWKGQSNDAYWHGVFGGLYSSALRRITYHHLVRAQTIAESAIHGAGEWIDVRKEVLDGCREYSIETSSMGLRVCPEMGGSLAELDLKDPAVNVFDTLRRRREAYHDEVRRAGTAKRPGKIRSIHEPMASKEAGLGALLTYDRNPKFSFLDFIVAEQTDVGDFVKQTYQESAPFAASPYGMNLKRDASGVSLSFSRSARLENWEDSIRVDKVLSVPAARPEIGFRYAVKRIVGSSSRRTLGRLAIEINFGSLGDSGFIRSHTTPTVHSRVDSRVIEYRDIGVRATVELSRPVDLWTIPIKSVSRSESGFESSIQGASIIPNFPLSTEAHNDSYLEIRLSLAKIT